MAKAPRSASALVPFQFEGTAVRIVTRDGEPWFVAADVARVLDYRDADKAVRLLEEDEKGTQNVGTPGGMQKAVVISESGLYALIMRSRKPQARRFRRWVTAEVLPAIQRTGGYGVTDADAMHRALSDPGVLRGLLAEYVDKARAAEQQLAVAAPKAAALDTMLATVEVVTDPVELEAHRKLMRALGGTRAIVGEIETKMGRRVRKSTVRAWRYRGIARPWRPLIASMAAMRGVPLPQGFLSPDMRRPQGAPEPPIISDY